MPETPIRRRALTALATAALLVAAACSGSSDGDGDDAAVDEPATTEAGAEFPVTVDTPHGEVTVPEAPTEVVALSLDYVEAMLALGIEPVAAPDAFEEGPWVTEVVGDAEIFTPDINQSESTYETLRLLAPDLMFGTTYIVDDERYPTLRGIAPTVTSDDLAGDTTAGAWELLTRQVGTVLGLPDEADALVEETLAAIAEARDAHPGAEGRVITLAAPYGAGSVVAATGTDHSGLRFLEALGFEVLDLEGQGDAYEGGRTELSLENLDLLAEADVVLLGDFGDGALEALQENPLYESIADRAVVLDPAHTTAINSPTALNIPPLLELLAPHMERLDDGS